MDIDIERTVTVRAAVLATAGGMITAAATFVWKFLKAGVAGRRPASWIASTSRRQDRNPRQDMGMKLADVDDELKHQREAAERSRARIHEAPRTASPPRPPPKEDLRGLRDDIREMLRMRPRPPDSPPAGSQPTQGTP